MKKHLKKISSALVLMVLLFSCQKETNKVINQKPIGNTSQPTNRSLSVWGVGSDDRVYKWNGTAWYEPNPSARLKQVSLSKNYNGEIWGVGAGNRVWRWNGASWYQPNPSVNTITQISCISNNEAWGRSATNRVYRTLNGGVTWDEYNVTPLKYISAGSSYFVVGITTTNRILFFDGSGWIEPNPNSSLYSANACSPDGAWGIGANNRIFKYDGSKWYEPNPLAGLYTISAVDYDQAWGIGASNRVFRTINGGATWEEPNLAAKLTQVAMGYN